MTPKRVYRLMREDNLLCDLADARASIAEFQERVYNHKRLHSALGYLPPVEFESQHHSGLR